MLMPVISRSIVSLTYWLNSHSPTSFKATNWKRVFSKFRRHVLLLLIRRRGILQDSQIHFQFLLTHIEGGEKHFSRLWQSSQGDTKVLESAHDVTIYRAAILKIMCWSFAPPKTTWPVCQAVRVKLVCKIGLMMFRPVILRTLTHRPVSCEDSLQVNACECHRFHLEAKNHMRLST